MFYTSTDRETLVAYNQKVVDGEGYDGVRCVRWDNIIEHQDGNLWAILCHPRYPLIDGFDENDEPLDAPKVENIQEFYPVLENDLEMIDKLELVE